MADLADIAGIDIESELEHHLAQQRLKTETNKESAFYCIECDDVIPHQRRVAIRGVQMCVSCQTDAERKR